MCLGVSAECVRLIVQGRENFVAWQPMHYLSRRHFVENVATFRWEAKAWLNTLGSGVPQPIRVVLLNSSWEDFFPRGSLRAGIFCSALFFFDVNDAPIALRRLFWKLLIAEPCFDRGMAGTGHPYVRLYRFIVTLPYLPFSDFGALARVIPGKSSWTGRLKAFNIWGCRGVFDEGAGGWARRVDTNSILLHVDWNSGGLLEREVIVKRMPDLYPFLDFFDEGGARVLEFNE